MALAPYNPAALGPSQAATMDQQLATDQMNLGFTSADATKNMQRLNQDYTLYQKPQLQSSMGATGQFYSTAARKAEAQQYNQYSNQFADLGTTFQRAQMEMARNQAFAAMGIII
jgi:hypothetical protein